MCRVYRRNTTRFILIKNKSRYRCSSLCHSLWGRCSNFRDDFLESFPNLKIFSKKIRSRTSPLLFAREISGLKPYCSAPLHVPLILRIKKRTHTTVNIFSTLFRSRYPSAYGGIIDFCSQKSIDIQTTTI